MEVNTVDIVPPPKKVLTLDEKLKVSYCIPNWLRDEQVRVNTANVKGRIEEHQELRSEPIALVNFGPSLNDTWEKIRDFKYIMTCSGAHKFLVDRGIIPTHHIDVDPREHKIKLIGTPQQGTEYLIASTCHPKLFEFLKDYNLKLWHIFDNDENGLRVLPHGEWAITGGCSAGTRTMTLARFLGFTDQHIFGMDGCEGPTGKHAAEHPNQPKDYCVINYEGVEYRTTPSMLEAAKNTFHELDIMKDVKATFYGEGLVQAMSRNYARKVYQGNAFIAFNKPELISSTYLAMNKQLHSDNLAYGVGGGRHADTVKQLYRILHKTNDFVSVLDYGAGKGYLGKALPFSIFEYDPAIPGKQDSPRPADLVVCTDVLEHIEPDRLAFVLNDLQRCVKQIGFFVVNTGPASKTLPDGRNTHLIQKDLKWWRKHLEKFFIVAKINKKGPELYVVVAPKAKKKKVHPAEVAATETVAS